MKKKLLTGLAIAFLLLTASFAALAETPSGVWGTCAWEIQEGGVMVISAGTPRATKHSR